MTTGKCRAPSSHNSNTYGSCTHAVMPRTMNAVVGVAQRATPCDFKQWCLIRPCCMCRAMVHLHPNFDTAIVSNDQKGEVTCRACWPALGRRFMLAYKRPYESLECKVSSVPHVSHNNRIKRTCVKSIKPLIADSSSDGESRRSDEYDDDEEEYGIDLDDTSGDESEDSDYPVDELAGFIDDTPVDQQQRYVSEKPHAIRSGTARQSAPSQQQTLVATDRRDVPSVDDSDIESDDQIEATGAAASTHVAGASNTGRAPHMHGMNLVLDSSEAESPISVYSSDDPYTESS